jgi:hypothetical protein
MKKRTLLISAIIFTLVAAQAMAMQGHDGQVSREGHDMQPGNNTDHGTHDTDTGSSNAGGTFKHHDSMDGMKAEFQVMSLASMNTTSDKGETHHVMVNLSETDGGAPIKKAVGKIKVVGPDGKEQVSTLKNYNGILAANFTFKEPGKYGIICLLKNEAKKHVFKFWYHHM